MGFFFCFIEEQNVTQYYFLLLNMSCFFDFNLILRGVKNFLRRAFFVSAISVARTKFQRRTKNFLRAGVGRMVNATGSEPSVWPSFMMHIPLSKKKQNALRTKFFTLHVNGALVLVVKKPKSASRISNLNP